MNILQQLVAQAQQKKQQLYNDVKQAPQAIAHTVVPAVTHAAGQVAYDATHNPATAALGRNVVKPAVNYMENGGVIGMAHPAYQQFSRGVSHGLERSAIGTAQAASGLFDLAGGQHGTSRVDKRLDQFAKGIDATAAQQHINPLLYKGSQAAGDALQMALGGGELKVAGKALASLPKVGKAARPLGTVLQAIEKPGQAITALGKDGNYLARVGSRAAGNILSPRYQAANAAFTASQEGKNASHGQIVTPQSAGIDLATGAVGIPALGAIGHEIAPSLRKGVQETLPSAAKSANRQVKAAYDKQNTIAAGKATVKDLQRQKAALQQRIQNTPVGNHVGAENVQRHIDMLDGRIASTKAAAPKLTVKDRLLAPNIGLGTRPVTRTELPMATGATQPTIPADRLDGILAHHEAFPQSVDLEALKSEFKNDPTALSAIETSQAKVKTTAAANKVTAQKQAVIDQKFTSAKTVGDIRQAEAMQRELQGKSIPAPATTPTELPPGEAVPAPQKPASTLPQAADGVSSNIQPSPAPRTGRIGIQESVNPKPLAPEVVSSLPANRTTEVKLNTNRLNTSDATKATLDAETTARVEKMSNADVQKIARSAGIDAKSNTIQQTRQQIAEHLNVRQNALRLQNEAEQARLAGNTEQAASLLKQSADMGRTSREQGTDLARQLQARRIIANELDTPQQRIFKLLDQAGVHPDTYTRRLAEVDFTKPDEVIAAYREMVPAKFSDWLDKYRYSNMLSSPMTQLVNFSGNLEGGMVVRPIQKAFEGGVDALHSLATGAPRTRLAGEAGAYLKGYAKNIPAGFRAFGDALSGKTMVDNPDYGDLAHSPLATKGFKGAADKVLGFIPKMMEAGDEAFQATIKGAETGALNYRQAKGINAGDIAGKAQDAADYTLFRQKLGQAGEGHFLNAVDYIPNQVSAARNSKNPIVRNASKLIFPFVKTGTNISKQMIEYSPLGVATAPGHADKTAQIAKAIMGTTLTGVAAGYLATSDRLTFATPTDANEKQKFLAQGKQAYSVKIGPHWVSYQRQHPALAFQLASVAAVNDALRNKKINQSTADATLNGLASISRFFIDQSYFKNAQDFLNNASGTGSVGQQGVTALASQGSNIANQFVPARAAMTWLNNFIDQVQRQPDSSASAFDQFKQQFESQLPHFSKNVPARLDNLGNPLKKPLPVVNNLVPAKISTQKSDNNPKLDAVSNEVDRLARQDNQIALAKQPGQQKIAGTDVNLNGQQTKALTDTVNKQVKDGWNKLIATPEYKSLNDADKRNALKSVKTDMTSAAKRQYGADNNIVLKDKPSKADTAILTGNFNASQYAKPMNNNGTYSTSSAVNVNSKIDGHSQKVLGVYNSLNSEQNKQKAYSENDWDYKVAQAKYDNAVANGSLSKAQLISQKDAVTKAKVGSSFTKDTRDLYGLSKDEVYNLITTDQNGKQIASDLLKYGDALQTATGTKNKFRTSKGVESFTPASVSGSGGTSLSSLLAGFKTPYSDMVKNSTKGSALARSAHLAKKKA